MELPTAHNVLHAYGSLRGADIGIFTSMNVNVSILFCGTHCSVSV